MKTIYLVRHGESVSNVGGPILGGAKTHLTEVGREQATFVGKRLSRLPVDVIIASTYLRAKQTGGIIADNINKPIEYSDLFTEWFQGSSRMGKDAHDPELEKQTKTLIEHLREPDYRMADEENFADLNKRAQAGLAYLAERPEEHIVVVTHGLFAPVLIGKAIMEDDFTGRDCQHFMQAFRMKNTGLTVLTHNTDLAVHQWWKTWTIITWNDHAHLG